MSEKINIFFTGATGYIGGSVLYRLLNHPTAPRSQITALVRSPEKAKKLEVFGVKSVIGSHSDVDKIEQLASESDVVFATADADDVGATKAILAGLKKRHEATGTVPILIHTSGTGVLTDDARGKFAYDTIYDDTNPEQIESLPDTQFHRNVDLLIVAADKEGYARTHIILPSTIYGIVSNPLVDAGIQNPHSIQIPRLITEGLARGHPVMTGEGKNKWPDVQIDDVADLYIILYDHILRSPSTTGHGREGFYFGENGEHTLLDVYKAVGQALYEIGKAKSPEPVPFTEQELSENFMLAYFGSNSRCKSSRGRALGWKPKYTVDDFLASLKPEVVAIAKRYSGQ